MKTPQEWLKLRTEVLHDGGDADLHKWISAIQDESLGVGYSAGYSSGRREYAHTESPNRIGQWKLTELGAAKCIACGGGYVMCRSRGRLPWCVDVRIWDELIDYTLIIDDPLDFRLEDK